MQTVEVHIPPGENGCLYVAVPHALIAGSVRAVVMHAAMCNIPGQNGGLHVSVPHVPPRLVGACRRWHITAQHADAVKVCYFAKQQKKVQA